jgi:hypothetical protein
MDPNDSHNRESCFFQCVAVFLSENWLKLIKRNIGRYLFKSWIFQSTLNISILRSHHNLHIIYIKSLHRYVLLKLIVLSKIKLLVYCSLSETNKTLEETTLVYSHHTELQYVQLHIFVHRNNLAHHGIQWYKIFE